ncbi:MAG: glycosyltransferase family 4 protein [Lachnospiraceae bacterium]|nr:glycosyltransferase family 4 protein [Lachnospiraceae bacterium]
MSIKIVFLSNFFNHHQAPLSNALASNNQVDYYFVETETMPQERVNLGYEMDTIPQYVINYLTYKNDVDRIIDLIDSADVVIIGSAPEFLIRSRRKQKKLIFRYYERLYKKPIKWWSWPKKLICNQYKYGGNPNEYVLCASSFTASDFALTGNYIGKCYKWGYFPETKTYSPETLLSQKERNSILWVGRMIDWKHPELAIHLAVQLKKRGYRFKLRMIGIGEMKEDLSIMIKENDLQDSVFLLGAMKPSQVREYMEKTEIFLFTSDRNEGWGAVLNESMNSCCAVVANYEIGSVGYMMKNGINGLVYNDLDGLLKQTVALMNAPGLRKKIGKMAYQTIIYSWNAENAAKRFVRLSMKLIDNKKCKYKCGPCSSDG